MLEPSTLECQVLSVGVDSRLTRIHDDVLESELEVRLHVAENDQLGVKRRVNSRTRWPETFRLPELLIVERKSLGYPR